MTEPNEQYIADVEEAVNHNIEQTAVDQVESEVYVIAQGVINGLERAGFEMPLYRGEALKVISNFVLTHSVRADSEEEDED